MIQDNIRHGSVFDIISDKINRIILLTAIKLSGTLCTTNKQFIQFVY